jgi:hypothetical protein
MSSNYGVTAVKPGPEQLSVTGDFFPFWWMALCSLLNVGFTPHSLTAAIASHQPALSPIVLQSDLFESEAAPTVKSSPYHDPWTQR